MNLRDLWVPVTEKFVVVNIVAEDKVNIILAETLRMVDGNAYHIELLKNTINIRYLLKFLKKR